MSGPLSDPGRLLTAWERAAASPSVARGAAIVAAAGLGPARGSALDLPLGECAALAVRIHADSFGAAVACAATCPGCAEPIELTLDLDTLPTAPDPETTATVAGRTATVRSLTTRDLLDAGTADDPRALLLNRCLLAVEDDPAVDAAAVRTAAVEAVERMAGAAGVVVRADCPSCGAEVRVGLDPGHLLWEQVAATAERLLVEVAELAAAYGWTERDVLRLSPMRRAAYRELAGR